MDVKLTEALRGYGASKMDLPDADQSDTALVRAGKDFAETLAMSEEVAQQAMMGNADPHALVEALANSQLAVETATVSYTHLTLPTIRLV